MTGQERFPFVLPGWPDKKETARTDGTGPSLRMLCGALPVGSAAQRVEASLCDGSTSVAEAVGLSLERIAGFTRSDPSFVPERPSAATSGRSDGAGSAEGSPSDDLRQPPGSGPLNPWADGREGSRPGHPPAE